jgi:hypothetical protein
MATFETLKDVVVAGAGGPAILFNGLFQNLAWWVPWAVLAPAVAFLCRRVNFFQQRSARAAIVHGVAAIAVGLLHTVTTASLISLAPRHPDAWPGIVAAAVGLTQGYLVLDVVTYGAVTAGLHLVEYAAMVRRQESEAAALTLRASELERALTTAKLETLRAQLNPHFLFNTLNSIAGLVRQGERQAAVTTIARLGELLRESLSAETGPLVDLATELAILDRYLAIEEVRFEERLLVQIDVPAEAERAQVPVLLLQPLVENAIRHGIATWPDGGRVNIQASIKDEDLWIAIENLPMTPRPPAGDKPVKEGIGLRNTRGRLTQHFGPRGLLALHFLTNGGCRVEVRLPLSIES